MQTERTGRDVALGGHQQLSERDVAYVRSTFRPQSEDEQHRAVGGFAPKPAYVLPDGMPMVPATSDEELAAAVDADDLRRRFTRRWLDAGGPLEDVEAELESWLDGGYGVCLRCPGPELILAKAGLAQAITTLTARPLPRENWWRSTLRSTVAAYEALVLPFASIDAARFGQATSRTRLVDAVREQWPEAFATELPDR